MASTALIYVLVLVGFGHPPLLIFNVVLVDDS